VKTNKKEEGFALVTVLLFVLVILLIGTAAISLASNDVLISAKHKEETQAFYAAEAGLTEAVEKVKKEKVSPPATVEGSVYDPAGANPSYTASYEVEIRKEGEKIRLNSTGYMGTKADYQAKAAVSALLSYNLQPAFEYAFFGPTLDLGKTKGLRGNFYAKDQINIDANTGNISGTVYFAGSKDKVEVDNSWKEEWIDDDTLLLTKGNDAITIEFISSPLPMPEVNTESLKERAIVEDTFYNTDQIYSSPTNFDFTQKNIRFIDGNLTLNFDDTKDTTMTYSGRGTIVITGKLTITGTNNHKAEIIRNDANSSLVFISLDNNSNNTPAVEINNIDTMEAIVFAPYGKIDLRQSSNKGMTVEGSLVGKEVNMSDTHNITFTYNPSTYFTNGIPPGIGQWQMEKWKQLP